VGSVHLKFSCLKTLWCHSVLFSIWITSKTSYWNKILEINTKLWIETLNISNSGVVKNTLMNCAYILLQDQETVSLGSYWCCTNVVYREGKGWRRRDDQILSREQVFNCRASRKVCIYCLGWLTPW
jgi:hypothetical protein